MLIAHGRIAEIGTTSSTSHKGSASMTSTIAMLKGSGRAALGRSRCRCRGPEARSRKRFLKEDLGGRRALRAFLWAFRPARFPTESQALCSIFCRASGTVFADAKLRKRSQRAVCARRPSLDRTRQRCR